MSSICLAVLVSTIKTFPFQDTPPPYDRVEELDLASTPPSYDESKLYSKYKYTCMDDGTIKVELNETNHCSCRQPPDNRSDDSSEQDECIFDVCLEILTYCVGFGILAYNTVL